METTPRTVDSLSVDFAAIAYLDYGDDELCVLDGIEYAVVALPHSVSLLARQLLSLRRARIGGQGANHL